MDIENTTKAAQCAGLLCDDLTALAKSAKNPFLADLALELQAEALNLRVKLDRAVKNLADTQP